MKCTTIIACSLVLLLAGCEPSTKITKTWMDPSLTPETAQAYKKVLVIAGFRDQSTRRIAEDKIVAAFKNVKGVQSYTYLQPIDTIRGVVEDRLEKDGFDGVVAMHLADVDKSLSYVPGTTYYGWYGYGWGGSPGYYQQDKTYYVETSLYSLESKKLVWSGTTSSLNPGKVDRALDEIIATLKGQLQKQKLIK